jgi:hypothetical protein
MAMLHFSHTFLRSCALGRAIAQAVSRWLPTAEARVRIQVKSCGLCGEQSGNGAGFLRVHRFPLPILIPPTAPHSSSIIRRWYNRPVSGRRTKWTQSHPTPRNLKKSVPLSSPLRLVSACLEKKETEMSEELTALQGFETLVNKSVWARPASHGIRDA